MSDIPYRSPISISHIETPYRNRIMSCHSGSGAGAGAADGAAATPQGTPAAVPMNEGAGGRGETLMPPHTAEACVSVCQ